MFYNVKLCASVFYQQDSEDRDNRGREKQKVNDFLSIQLCFPQKKGHLKTDKTRGDNAFRPVSKKAEASTGMEINRSEAISV